MSAAQAVSTAARYVAWVRRHWLPIVLAHVVLIAGALYLIAFHLPLYADFSYLLPQDAPSVVDLRRLEERVQATDLVLVIVEAPTPDVRAAATREMTEGMRAIGGGMVDRVVDSDQDVRDFLRTNESLLVPLPDLIKARDALKKKIGKLNPLYIDIDDDDATTGSGSGSNVADSQLDDLTRKRKQFEAEHITKSTMVSADGLISRIEVSTSFRGTDAGHGHELLAAIDQVRARVLAAHPGVQIGVTGGIVTAVAEHNAILNGMLLSSIVTTVLVGLVLALYFRSATLLILLVTTLGIATTIAFGAAAITVGHLNAATAFLGAIIAGNGVNYGILLIARYLEERRHGDIDAALAAAIVGTIRPTLVASLGASIAYGSLAATSFKGFADFAVIGAVGMAICWIESFLLLPALMLRFGRSTRVFNGDPVVGGALVKVLGFRNSTRVCVVAAIVLAAATGIVYRYVSADPFEYDIKKLRSEGADAKESRDWMDTSDRYFGRGYSGRTFIAADKLTQVPLIVQALRAIDGDLAMDDPRRTIGDVRSYTDVDPPDQAQRLVVLAEIRKLMDSIGKSTKEDPEDYDKIRDLRPPDNLKPITEADLPFGVRDQLTEKNKNFGYLISIRPGEKLDEWNGHDSIRFANAVRTLHLPDGETVTTSGASVIFADILVSISGDGPIVTGIAGAGLMIMVVLLVGRNRRSVAVLVATISGSLLMIAVCALLGLKVTFLDFVALPITLGLGVDYAINVAHRQDSDATPDPIATLRTSGAAVFVCSLTTIIGYGSLLVSDNLAIRGFGIASLIGEITCLLTALVFVPALLVVGRQRPVTAELPKAA